MPTLKFNVDEALGRLMINSIRKAKIAWHCRRGMLELDLILGQFAKSNLDKLVDKQLDAFETLLTFSDPELFSWFMGSSMPINQELAKIVDLIKLQNLSR